MVQLATFDLIPTEVIDEEKYYWPEADPFNTNFEMAGVESELLLANIGFVLYMIYVHCLMILIHACLHRLKSCNRYFEKIHQKLGSYLYWEGLNRFYIEVFLDLTLQSILNLYTADWNS